jgi:glycosyltransferase involved in cell wall biosynthesis
MPSITALVHTQNDATRVGRCLETLYPCDDILVVDHGSRDGTVEAAREYGARVVPARPGVSPDYYSRFAESAWILCLDAHESLSESLAASLFELKSELKSGARSASRGARADSPHAFSVFLREETADGWFTVCAPQTRLVPADWNRWQGKLPLTDPGASTLEGPLLRFIFP